MPRSEDERRGRVRRSDTHASAKAAADQLVIHGVRPSVNTVREYLGGGDRAIINEALGEWWQELGQRLSIAAATEQLWYAIQEEISRQLGASSVPEKATNTGRLHAELAAANQRIAQLETAVQQLAKAKEKI